MNEIEKAKEEVLRYYRDFINATIDIHGIDLNTIICDCVTAGYNKGYNKAINDVDNLIDKHDEEVYVGVVEDILKLKKS